MTNEKIIEKHVKYIYCKSAKQRPYKKHSDIYFKTMKFPWFASDKSSKEKSKPIETSEKNDTKKNYKLSELPENLQRIALLIQQTDKEIKYLNKKLEINLTAKKELEKQLSIKLNTINKNH